MAVVKMKKITVIGLNSSRTAFIHELMHLGVVEINSQEGAVNDEDWMPDIFRTSNSADVLRLEADIARVSTALDAINRYDTGKKPMFHTRREVGHKEFVDHMNRMKTETEMNVDMAMSASKEISEGQNEINRLKGMIEGLRPWIELDIPLNGLTTACTETTLGCIAFKMDVNELTNTLLEKVPTTVINTLNIDKQQRYLSVIHLKEEKDIVFEILQQYGFMPITLIDHAGTPLKAMWDYGEKILELETLVTSKERVLADLAADKGNIEYLYDSLHMRRDRAKVVGDMLSTESVFYFDGWMPASSQDAIEELLNHFECYYDIAEPCEEDDVPVVLVNDAFSTPFEAITNMYSLPGKSDIDPTKIMAPFYFIFFGMMLGDAAYGLILAAICWTVLKKFKLEGTIYKMMKMFFYCGISTFIWGVIFGGWFGNLFTVIADTFFGKEFVIKPLWFDPLSDPMLLLIFSLILGGIHLLVGMGIQGYVYIRDGKLLDALFDIGLWYILLIGLVLFGVGGMVTPGLATAGKVMSIVGAVGIFLTGGRGNKGILGKLSGGFGSLYGITGYLSDVLSYSRLLALGLATGVVAQVINTLGSLAGDGIVGVIVLFIAFAFGSVFNIAINALGAFVHSSRLQYVEFFGKFYTGGGRAFEPFERKTKYIKIDKEDEFYGR